MTATRREFLRTGVLGAGVALLAPRLSASPPRRRRTLVILQLAGGNDSLNTLIPYADARYRRLRPTLAIAEREIVPLTDAFGVHPSFAPLMPLFAGGRLTFVDGVGFPSLDRSHFRCQDVWQTADEAAGSDHQSRRGWIGRYADLHLGGSAVLSSLSVGTRTPLGMSAETRRATVMEDVDRFAAKSRTVSVAEASLQTALRDLYDAPRSGATARGVAERGRDLFAALDELRSAPPRHSVVPYPDSRLGRSLHGVASLLETDGAVSVVWIVAGGYDTHARQPEQHAALLRDLADSLHAFDRDLARRGLADHVLTMAWSEFGRRAAENSSQGTDHGKAGLVLFVGAGLAAGLHGAPPDLGRLEDGDLPARIDFRSVYATVLRRWLDADPRPILGGSYSELGFLRQA